MECEEKGQHEKDQEWLAVDYGSVKQLARRLGQLESCETVMNQIEVSGDDE